jgi:signal transduction histidine kinase
MEMEITGPVTPEQRAQLERVSSSGRHLLALIDDILDLSKVEAGRLVVSRGSADATRAVEDSLALVRPQAEARRIALRVEEDGARGVRYRGDEQRVQQILVNLLSNAVKFTSAGGRITVRCARLSDAPAAALSGEGSWVAITVEDTGIGIGADKLERIFQPFEQGESGYTRVHSGTGLGLTISRRLARLMDGDLTVESTVGEGSRFTLWLPAADGAIADDGTSRFARTERTAGQSFE